MREKIDVVGILSAGVLGATLLTVLCGLVMLMSGCQQPAVGEDPFPCHVNVARAVVESAKADVSTETTGSEDVSFNPQTIDTDAVNYSTTPAVRRWKCTVGRRVNDPADLIRVLTPFAEQHSIDMQWLESRSHAELIALHSDMRENAVQRDCVPRAGPSPAEQPKQGRWIRVKRCVGGRCYLNRAWVEE